MATRARLEPATLRLTAVADANLSAVSGVAYKNPGTIFPSLVAPNPGPKLPQACQRTAVLVNQVIAWLSFLRAKRLALGHPLDGHSFGLVNWKNVLSPRPTVTQRDHLLCIQAGSIT